MGQYLCFAQFCQKEVNLVSLKNCVHFGNINNDYNFAKMCSIKIDKNQKHGFSRRKPQTLGFLVSQYHHISWLEHVPLYCLKHWFLWKPLGTSWKYCFPWMKTPNYWNPIMKTAHFLKILASTKTLFSQKHKFPRKPHFLKT